MEIPSGNCFRLELIPDVLTGLVLKAFLKLKQVSTSSCTSSIPNATEKKAEIIPTTPKDDTVLTLCPEHSRYN